MTDSIGICTRRSLFTGVGAAAVASATGLAHADSSSLPLPKSDPILTISGKIGVHNVGDTATFDMASLEALGVTSFTTTTPWTKQVAFQGVLFETLMNRVGSTGTKALAYALNDYVVEIPLKGFTSDGPLLATKMNGSYMPIQKFGPLFVVYLFDSHPEWRNNAVYARCIWQLQKLVIV
ncbi:molybdopterin-dependent oxidoreductase [Acidisoma cladoniae]|uniref:molybdopterin-dependent oxidoreductase n=1 Tax=Acidisoma cladoniae TaxID=3040935 RepID=UPI00254BC4EF|nr:molybdopterin-dependent oxidoreductase [Acidisoma sp. PAMC 29798]